VTVYVNRHVLADAKDPLHIAFAFGPLGRCRLMLSPQTVLFACVHNAGRSQMAAAFFSAAADPSRVRALSAGTRPGSAVHAEVAAVMKEVGIDLSSAAPRLLTDDLVAGVDVLITMGCGEECPHVPGVERDDWPLPDPAGRPLPAGRAIRDQIRARVAALVDDRGWRRSSSPTAAEPR
jgi:arsenate reductase